ncbi:hypothetical protein ET33_15690 [Paenibacillus tyrfis]|uniref:Uncharacterized protein n=1 Tax=Paenibacillus tyrfis TaxID=1501230 RepID=A0A081NYP4_9BACL|nr:hypothetical protein ET33_15690 [Paenibacillus tyrfis]
MPTWSKSIASNLPERPRCSWLMELTERVFSKDARLDEIKGVMHSSGEGKWTAEEAMELQLTHSNHVYTRQFLKFPNRMYILLPIVDAYGILPGGGDG